MNKLQKQALKALDVIHKKEKKYRELNTQARELQGDFPTHIQSIDSEYMSEFIGLLDEILGDELASYLLFETDGSKAYYYQLADEEKKFYIRNTKDIETFIKWRDKPENKA